MRLVLEIKYTVILTFFKLFFSDNLVISHKSHFSLQLTYLQILPFDDTLCVLEPCLNYQRCSIDLQFDEAASFISSEAMLFRPIRTRSIYSCGCPQGYAGQLKSQTCVNH